jgi:hypothetical protein
VSDHRERFERWRKKLPKNTAYLVGQVLARILPEFENRGFAWYANYAAGDPARVGANVIPLQRRCDNDWPTVEVRFNKRLRPWFTIYFSLLPPICMRLTQSGHIDIPREKATVTEAQAYFTLRRGKWPDHKDGEFGYDCFILISSFTRLFGVVASRFSFKRVLDTEVAEALSLLPVMFNLFDSGIPEEWLSREQGGYVSENVAYAGSWRLFERRILHNKGSSKHEA